MSVSKWDLDSNIVGDSLGNRIAKVSFDADDGWHGNLAEAKDNARLVAAAPELLEALEDLLNCVTGQHDYDQKKRCEDNALAAIAKARGQ